MTTTDRVKSKLETTGQAAIVEALEGVGLVVRRQHSGSVRVRRGFMYLGSKGWPDLLVLGPRGLTVLLETKSDDGDASEQQEATHAKLRALGHIVYVVRSAQEAVDVVTARAWARREEAK